MNPFETSCHAGSSGRVGGAAGRGGCAEFIPDRDAQTASAGLLPDLGMAKLSNLSVNNSNGGVSYVSTLRSSTLGPFEAHGTNRNDNNNPVTMDTVARRIYEEAGGYRDVPTAATMFYAGDGHN